jgi:hypothetical protein
MLFNLLLTFHFILVSFNQKIQTNLTIWGKDVRSD